MSAENVGVVRELYERYVSNPEATFELFDPEIEWSEPEEIPDSQVYRGHDGVRDSMRKFVGTWDDFRNNVQELIDAGDSVIARVRITGRGKGSGVGIDAEQFQVWTLRDGKAVRLQMFFDKAGAERAAGLAATGPAAEGKR
jgi:uncharacterized protein